MIPGLPHLLPQLPCHQWQHLLSGNPNKVYQVKWVNSTQIQEWTKSQYLFSPGILLKTVNNIQNRYWKSCRRKSKVIRANIDKKSEQQVSADCSKARFRDRERRWWPAVWFTKLPFELEANQVAICLVVDIWRYTVEKSQTKLAAVRCLVSATPTAGKACIN